MEFRHGPIASIDEGTVVVLVIPPGRIFEEGVRLFEELKEKEARVVVLTDQDELGMFDEKTIYVDGGVDEYLAPVLYVIPLQMLSFYCSVGRGINPDRPRYLSKVVKI